MESKAIPPLVAARAYAPDSAARHDHELARAGTPVGTGCQQSPRCRLPAGHRVEPLTAIESWIVRAA